MTFFAIPTLLGQNAIAAAIAGTAPLTLTHIAVGDGNGQPVTPLETAVGLVNQRALLPATMTRVGNIVTIETAIDANTGGWTIREVGVYGNGGQLLFIGNYPATEKGTIATGAFDELIVSLRVVVSETAQVTIALNPTAYATQGWVDEFYEKKLLRFPWIAVNQVGLNAPPGSPAMGDSYIVGAAPTGAWATQAHNLAQWNGAWVFRAMVPDSLVMAQDTDMVHKRIVSGWEPWFATTPEHIAGLLATKPATPAGVAAMLNNSLGGFRSTRLLSRVGLRRPR